MRVPHTIPDSTLKAYEPSVPTKELVGERSRRLKSENWHWDETIPPTLVKECIRFFVSEFDEHKNALPLLQQNDLILLLETLSTSLPLDIVIPLIPEGIYWKRRCTDTWDTLNDVTIYGNSWKRMFVERYVRDLIEAEEPGYTDWDEMGNTLKLCSPYVNSLDITQLQPPRIMETVVEPPDTCVIEEFLPEHLDLGPVLTILENLRELNLQFGVKGIGMKFTFKCFRTHPKDIERLGKGLSQSKNLRILRITCSDIDDNKLIVILKSLEGCTKFEHLTIAHCKVTNIGAKAVGHFITIMPSLKHVNLENNEITAEGAQGLAYALTVKDCAQLETLDLKFNLIGETGGKYLATALCRSEFPLHIKIAGCGLGEQAGADLVDMLGSNSTLLTMDLTNNALGPEVGSNMAEILQTNFSILRIDVRNCGFTEECEETIHQLTFRNREKVRKKKISSESSYGLTVMPSFLNRKTTAILL